MSNADRSDRRWLTGLLATLLLALALRAVFPVADPPWLAPIGITWHDEGVWAHNARNKALFGQWQLDQWNPMYVSPVFTGLEYLSFSVFGVGLWQARLVSVVAGVAATAALALGLRATATPAVALAGAALLAVNFTWVMYLEGGAAGGHDGRLPGGVVGVLHPRRARLALGPWRSRLRAARVLHEGLGGVFPDRARAGRVLGGMAGLAQAATFERLPWRVRWRRLRDSAWAQSVLLAAFVVPHWGEYSFYNLFVYGSRRSSVGAGPLLDRASWFPVVHGFFTRQWLLSRRLAGRAGRRARRAIAAPRPASACWRSGSCSVCVSWCCTTWATNGATSS